MNNLTEIQRKLAGLKHTMNERINAINKMVEELKKEEVKGQ